MIIEILETNPEPIDQQGEIVKFQRRVLRKEITMWDR